MSSSIQPACAVGRRHDNNNDDVMAAAIASMVVVLGPLPSTLVRCFIIAVQR